jgi:hypothetical protein
LALVKLKAIAILKAISSARACARIATSLLHFFYFLRDPTDHRRSALSKPHAGATLGGSAY